jgi:hypothetical protein
MNIWECVYYIDSTRISNGSSYIHNTNQSVYLEHGAEENHIEFYYNTK